ncbi:MAG: hypothetical protein ACREA8_08915 [Nitrosotalea sp.]
MFEKNMDEKSLQKALKVTESIKVDEISGRKVTIELTWFDVKGNPKSEKFTLFERELVEF